MTVAFVLSGGSSLGSIQVGMALALEERGIRPDMIVGSSVGALNGAWLASGKDTQGLAELWLSLSTRKIFPVRQLDGLRGFLGRQAYLVPNTDCVGSSDRTFRSTAWRMRRFRST